MIARYGNGRLVVPPDQPKFADYLFWFHFANGTMMPEELRERLKIPPFDPRAPGEKTITVDETARRLKICVGSVYRLIREGTLPATQLMHSAPWQIPLAALDSEAVRIGVRNVIERRPNNFVVFTRLKDSQTPWL